MNTCFDEFQTRKSLSWVVQNYYDASNSLYSKDDDYSIIGLCIHSHGKFKDVYNAYLKSIPIQQTKNIYFHYS